MSVRVKSPFNHDKIERDPNAYGLREGIIEQAVTELYNDHSIMLTGMRGIGKTSMSVQLQRILNGDERLLERCGIDLKFENFIIISHTCFHTDTLEELILGIIDQLQREASKSKVEYKINATFDVSLFGIFKAGINVEKKEKPEYNLLANKLVEAILHLDSIFVEPHINIFIDEVDQLNENINIAHFIKVVNESLNRQDFDRLSFILAGQIGVFNRLIENQPAFDRIVTYIELEPLDIENSEYVLMACLARSTQYAEITDDARNLIVLISCGYPYWIHRLGHESFISMLSRYDGSEDGNYFLNIETRDFLKGLDRSLSSATEKFNILIDSMTKQEKDFIFYLVEINSQQVPCIYEEAVVLRYFDNTKDFTNMIEGLVNKVILRIVATKDLKAAYCFQEELFRIFIKNNLIKKTEELRNQAFEIVEVPLSTHLRYIF